MSCNHQNLVLLKPPGQKLRCRRCHLTIDKAELAADFCPECYDRDGVRRRDFEVIELVLNEKVIYCCEQCGIRIEA